MDAGPISSAGTVFPVQSDEQRPQAQDGRRGGRELQVELTQDNPYKNPGARNPPRP